MTANTKKRGGARPGAGRKRTGRRDFRLWVKPAVMDAMLDEAKRRGFKTVREMLEEDLA